MTTPKDHCAADECGADLDEPPVFLVAVTGGCFDAEAWQEQKRRPRAYLMYSGPPPTPSRSLRVPLWSRPL